MLKMLKPFINSLCETFLFFCSQHFNVFFLFRSTFQGLLVFLKNLTLSEEQFSTRCFDESQQTRIHVTGSKRGKTRESKLWLVLELVLTGWESGASFFRPITAHSRAILHPFVLWCLHQPDETLASESDDLQFLLWLDFCRSLESSLVPPWGRSARSFPKQRVVIMKPVLPYSSQSQWQKMQFAKLVINGRAFFFLHVVD